MEETLAPRKDASPLLRPDNKRPREPNQRDDTPRVKPRQNPQPETFTPLNTSRSNILMEMKDLKELKWHPRMRSLPENRDRTKYCDFHQDHGHTTEGCLDLKQQIEALIRRGTINVIVGRTASGGDTNSGCKQYARQLPASSNTDLTHTEDITFGSKDLEGMSFPHDDALLISAIIANFEVKRIPVNNGSAANVLSHEAFVQMGIVGLPMTLGSEDRQVTHIITFKLFRTLIAYNAILGRPLLNKIRAIISTFHLAMKFPTCSGVGVVRGSQTMARQCYVTSVRKTKGDVMQLSELELELENRRTLTPKEELVEVELKPGRKVTVGRDLDSTIMAKLISCLSQN
ncbi:uncharacterized protein LOC111376946 [Olea europaea var. sylvestris]|uniref:uncharacterized protein LOC111376946 n=1 Tax=Olea europaea var. sylvestris TaxID=158386 RepID=UPI000C1CDF5E|nr:uncharacterized protein LOC111376946 [Olea europaea var. sylvestris]